MTTREEFQRLVRKVGNAAVREHDGDDGSFGAEGRAHQAVMRAWDAQAAEVARLSAEVEALRPVPLTAENADRARVVESGNGEIHKHLGADMWTLGTGNAVSTADLIARGATVLAWRKP